MARPHKPSYFPSRSCWRFKLNGRANYICKGVRPDQKPARDGIPRVVWEEMDRIVALAQGRERAGSDPNVFFLVQMYLAWLEKEAGEQRLTFKQFRNRLCHLEHLTAYPEFRDIRPASLTAEGMDGFFAWLRSGGATGRREPFSGHHVHNIGGAIRAMLRWASRPVAGRVPARLIESNPLEGYAWPKQPGSVRGYVEGVVVRRFLRWAWGRARWECHIRRGPVPDRELKPAPSVRGALKRHFDRVFLLMVRFQRLTGCRPNEACGLRWDEISPGPVPGVRWEPTLITIGPGRVKTRHQTDRARKIWITPPVARILRVLERQPGRHPEVVFPHMRARGAEASGNIDPRAGQPWPDSGPPGYKLRRLRALAIEMGMEGIESVGPTKLIAYAHRHGFASEGASLGFTDGQIAEQMGNTPEVMRKVYAHTIEDHAAERAAEIALKRRQGRGRRPA